MGNENTKLCEACRHPYESEDHLCRKAGEIEALRAERDALREALRELITWAPSAGTYRRLGFYAEASMRALEEARAVLRRKGWK